MALWRGDRPWMKIGRSISRWNRQTYRRLPGPRQHRSGERLIDRLGHQTPTAVRVAGVRWPDDHLHGVHPFREAAQHRRAGRSAQFEATTGGPGEEAVGGL